MEFKIWYSDICLGKDTVELLVVCGDFRAEGMLPGHKEVNESCLQ